MSTKPPQLHEAEWLPGSACPLCGSGIDLHRPFAAKSAAPEVIHYVLCARCGLVFQSPRPTDAALDRYYRQEYSRRSHSREHDPGKDRWVQQRRAEHLAGVVRSICPRYRRHLDVGSSSGELLKTFHRLFGTEAYGVEPSDAEREQAAAAGLRMAAVIEQLPRQAAHSFDLVTLSHVLEHVPDPVGMLRQIRTEWLAPDGLVLVETPNLFSHPSFEWGHLTAFTSQTLRGALASAGLEPIVLLRHGKPYSRMLPQFLLAIARTAPQATVASLPTPRPGWIRLRRRLGMLQLRSARFAARLLLGARRLQPWSE